MKTLICAEEGLGRVHFTVHFLTFTSIMYMLPQTRENSMTIWFLFIDSTKTCAGLCAPPPPLLPQLTMNRFLTFVLQGCVVSSDKRKKRNKKLIRVVVRDKSGIMRIYDLMSALDNEIKMNSAH